MASDPSKRASFLTIPSEVRERIYDFLFEGTSLTFETHSSHSLLKDPPFWIHLPPECNMLLVCRQIHAETKTRPNAIDSFRFRGDLAARAFIRNTNVRKRNRIRHVSGIKLSNYQYKKTLLNFAKLETVHIGPIHSIFYAALRNSFENATWDEMIAAVNSQNLDWIPPYGIEPLVSQGRYQRFIVDTNMQVLPSFEDEGNRRLWIPCTLDCVNKTFIRHHDQVTQWPPGVDPNLSTLENMMRRTGSRVAEAEREMYEKDSRPLKLKFRKLLEE